MVGIGIISAIIIKQKKKPQLNQNQLIVNNVRTVVKPDVSDYINLLDDNFADWENNVENQDGKRN